MSSVRNAGPLAAVFCAVLIGAIGGCCGTGRGHGGAEARRAPTVPAALRVDGPVVGRVHATGVQIYKGTAKPSGGLEWAFTAPEATFDGDLKGRHYKGPWWESASDGSKVKGHKLDEVIVSADAVPWLLLNAEAHEGTGVLAGVSYIQRINTVGGKAPAAAPAKAGEEVRVPYTADYVFYGEGAKRGG